MCCYILFDHWICAFMDIVSRLEKVALETTEGMRLFDRAKHLQPYRKLLDMVLQGMALDDIELEVEADTEFYSGPVFRAAYRELKIRGLD